MRWLLGGKSKHGRHSLNSQYLTMAQQPPEGWGRGGVCLILCGMKNWGDPGTWPYARAFARLAQNSAVLAASCEPDAATHPSPSWLMRTAT